MVDVWGNSQLPGIWKLSPWNKQHFWDSTDVHFETCISQATPSYRGSRTHTHTLQLQTCPFLRQLPVTGDLGFGETEDLGFGPTEDLGFEATEDLGFGANFSNLNHALSNLNQAPISRPMKPRRSRSHPKLRIVLFKKLRCWYAVENTWYMCARV